MTPEVELLTALTRVFPSLQGLPPAAQQERADQLGLFLAQGWSVGAQGLKQRGLEVPPEAVASLAQTAQWVVQAKRGGTTFLAHVRLAIQDEASFARLLAALGQLFARARTTTSGAIPVVTAAQLAAASPTPTAGTPAVARPPQGGPVPTMTATPPSGSVAAPRRPAAPSRGIVPIPNLSSRPTIAAPAPTATPTPSGVMRRPTIEPPPAPAAAPTRPSPPPASAPTRTPKPTSSDELDALDFTGGSGNGRSGAAAPDSDLDSSSLSDLDGSEPAPRSARAAPEIMDTPEPVVADELSGLDDLDGGEPSPARAGAPARAPARAAMRAPEPEPPLELEPQAEPAPEPSAAAPSVFGGSDFLASLVGGGLGPDPKGPAAPPAYAQPAPAQPAHTPPPAYTPPPASMAPAGATPPARTPAPPSGAFRIPAPPKSGAIPAAVARPNPTPPAVSRPGTPAAGTPAMGTPGGPAGGNASWDNFANALAAGGNLFRDDDAPAAPAAPAAPSPKSGASGRLPAPPAPASSDKLDLLPDEPAPSRDEPEIDPRILEEPIAPKVQTNRSKESERLKKSVSAVKIDEFDLDDHEEGEKKLGASRDDDSEELAHEAVPKDPAQAALYKFERTGDMTALAEARRLFQETAAKAPHGTAKAFAEAGLAKVLLLAGKTAEAAAQARASLERDPGNLFAVEIIVKSARGEADRARLVTGLAQARTLFTTGRLAEVRRLCEASLAQALPDAPQPWLMAALVAKVDQDDARFEQMILHAWARYPGKVHPDVPLGATLDIDLGSIMAAHGRLKFKTLDPEVLRRTVEGVDARDNLIAGMFRLAIASSRVGLARAHLLPKASKRKALMTIASGLIGLQHYDGAIEVLDKLAGMRPNEVEAKAIDNERRYAGQMRRAFDKPGVKAQLGKYKCVGVALLSQSTQERLAAAQKDRAAREGELHKEASEIAGICAKNDSIRDEVRAAAETLHKDDPVIPIELAEAELSQVREERHRLADPTKAPAPEKKGLFGKIAGAAAAAADKVASAAKDTQLKIKESQLQSRRDEAVRKLGLVIAKELRDHLWKTPQLIAFSKRAATLEAFIDFHHEEERLAKVELENLAKTVG